MAAMYFLILLTPADTFSGTEEPSYHGIPGGGRNLTDDLR